jgi:hypothetical protein
MTAVQTAMHIALLFFAMLSSGLESYEDRGYDIPDEAKITQLLTCLSYEMPALRRSDQSPYSVQ